MKEVRVKENNENKINVWKFFFNLGESLLKEDEKEIESIEEISGISKAESKEIKVCYNNIKELEQKYGIETKNLKVRKKSSPKIKSATISKVEKNEDLQINKRKEDDGKIQEI